MKTRVGRNEKTWHSGAAHSAEFRETVILHVRRARLVFRVFIYFAAAKNTTICTTRTFIEGGVILIKFVTLYCIRKAVYNLAVFFFFFFSEDEIFFFFFFLC